MIVACNRKSARAHTLNYVIDRRQMFRFLISFHHVPVQVGTAKRFVHGARSKESFVTIKSPLRLGLLIHTLSVSRSTAANTCRRTEIRRSIALRHRRQYFCRPRSGSGEYINHSLCVHFPFYLASGRCTFSSVLSAVHCPQSTRNDIRIERKCADWDSIR